VGSARAEQEQKVEWNEAWTRFHWWEGVATVGFWVASYTLDSRLHPPSKPNWSGPILLDQPARDLFRGGSVHVEHVAAKYSDTLLQTAVVFPIVVDAGIVALGVHREPDVAAQMALIDAEALGFAGVVSLFSERIVARERPYIRDCVNGASLDNPCGIEGDRISFFSGHTSATFTNAGLTCLHHQHLPLWGGGAPDVWACIWTLAVGTATGAFRLIADKHYLSDVVMGAVVGWTSGYILPSLLHYGFGTKRPKIEPVPKTGRIRPSIFPVPNGVALGAVGIF
jgi:hypothetical protein